MVQAFWEGLLVLWWGRKEQNAPHTRASPAASPTALEPAILNRNNFNPQTLTTVPNPQSPNLKPEAFELPMEGALKWKLARAPGRARERARAGDIRRRCVRHELPDELSIRYGLHAHMVVVKQRKLYGNSKREIVKRTSVPWDHMPQPPSPSQNRLQTKPNLVYLRGLNLVVYVLVAL